MSTNFQERRDKLRHGIRETTADALLVTDFTNVTYLTGFTGDSSYLLVRSDGELLISDGRYVTQLEEECPGLDLHIRRPETLIADAAVQVLGAAHLGRVAIEADSMSVALRDHLAEKLPKLELVSTTGLVETLRQIKDAEEIGRMRRAIRIAERSFEVLRASLRADKTEKQVADELEMQMRLLGAKAAGFPSIVAVGGRAALPHATPGNQLVGSGDLLLVDWGADAELYKSDLTRVLITGRIAPKLERIYGVVLRAQLAAIAAIRPGVKTGDVDAAARGIIAEAGYGERFDHGSGHGLGLQVHEAPRMKPGADTTLQPGMIVTVEPGIYLPEWGGVRIEDDVLVTPDGHEVLSTVGKQFEQAVVQLS